MINTIKDIWYAVTSPEKYRDYMNYKKRRLFLYVFVLVFVSGIITMGIPAAQFISQGGLTVLMQEQIPEFTASAEEGFWIEEPVEIDEYEYFIKADSDDVFDDITDFGGKYGTYEYVLIADQEQMYLKIPGIQEIQVRFDEMNDFSFTKDDILDYIPMMYAAMLWVFFVAMLMDFGYYLLIAFVVSWGAGVIASFMRLRLGNMRLFKMAVYAGTLSYILTLIQTVAGFSIPNFSVFSLIISTGYMYFALKEYKESGIEEIPPQKFDREG